DLFNAEDPAEGLLPVSLKAPEKREQGQPLAPLTGIRGIHRVLAPLNDPTLGGLAQVKFNTYYHFGSQPGDKDTVLAWIDDSVPAIIEHSYGAGKVFLFNTSANEAWGNLSVAKIYVPLVDRLLNYLSGGGVQRRFVVGDLVALPLEDYRAGEKIT